MDMAEGVFHHRVRSIQELREIDLQDGAVTVPSLDKEGKPRPEATAGVVRTIVESQISGGIATPRTTPGALRDLLEARCPHRANFFTVSGLLR